MGDIVLCLIIRRPWLDHILDGTKTVEYRSRSTTIRGVIGLIASGERGWVHGEVSIVGVRKTKSGNYGWELEDPRRYKQPVQINQKYGCVVWVRAQIE